MKFEHPTIKIEEPAAGHYVILGHNPRSVFIEGEGHVVPPHECYIAPEVPDDALLAVLEDREERRKMSVKPQTKQTK